MKSENTEPYQNLANASVLGAVREYRQALRRRKRKPHNKDAAAERDSIEEFFRSDWFAVLTELDPEYLITELNKEIFG